MIQEMELVVVLMRHLLLQVLRCPPPTDRHPQHKKQSVEARLWAGGETVVVGAVAECLEEYCAHASAE